jgi:hypothetical protein
MVSINEYVCMAVSTGLEVTCGEPPVPDSSYRY